MDIIFPNEILVGRQKKKAANEKIQKKRENFLGSVKKKLEVNFIIKDLVLIRRYNQLQLNNKISFDVCS